VIAAAAQELDSTLLRQAFGCFPTGVTAFCGLADGRPEGFAASSFTSVSLEPALVSICVANTSETWPKLARMKRLGISVLAGCFLAQAAPPVLFPTYSLRDASRDLGRQVPHSRAVRTVTAATLFLENDIKYRELSRHDAQIDGLVMLEQGGVARRFLQSGRADKLERTHAYPVVISPRYRNAEGRLEAPVVAVYRAK